MLSTSVPSERVQTCPHCSAQARPRLLSIVMRLPVFPSHTHTLPPVSTSTSAFHSLAPTITRDLLSLRVLTCYQGPSTPTDGPAQEGASSQF